MNYAGYTKLQTVVALTVLTLASVAIVVPVQHSYDEAGRLQVLAVGTQFRAAVLLVKETWWLRHQPQEAFIRVRADQSGESADLASAVMVVQTNAQGWPVDAWPLAEQTEDARITERAPVAPDQQQRCQNLWHGLLINAPPISGSRDGIRVEATQNGCRYVTQRGGEIDYHMPDGRVRLTIR